LSEAYCDAEFMRPWCSTIIAYSLLLTSADCFYASKSIKVVFIHEYYHDMISFCLSKTLFSAIIQWRNHVGFLKMMLTSRLS